MNFHNRLICDNQKQPKHPTTSESLDKLCSIDTPEHYSPIKMKKLLIQLVSRELCWEGKFKLLCVVSHIDPHETLHIVKFQLGWHRPVISTTQEVEAKELQVQDRPVLQIRFKATLGNLVDCLNVNSKQKTGNTFQWQRTFLACWVQFLVWQSQSVN